MRRIATLDGWRAIAILMVTLNHLAESVTNNAAVLYYTRFGGLGVDVFFALSGLLITRLLLYERDQTGQISLRAFYTRRCFRVLLPCYFYLSVTSLCGAGYARLELLGSIFFFRNYVHGSFYTIHLWTLAIEEHFYLLWPVAVVWITTKYGRQLALRRGPEYAMWTAVAIALWRIAGTNFFPGLTDVFPGFRTDYRLDSLLWGCVVGFYLHQAGGSLNRITPLGWTIILASYLSCIGYSSLLTRLWMPATLPLLIGATVCHPEWRLSRILESTPMKWVGKISYSLYLWQMVFLVQTTHSSLWWQRFPANIVLAFAVAAACYYCIDGPLQRVGARCAAALRWGPRKVWSESPAAFSYNP